MIKIGMTIGDRYEILEKIGTGGMSDVYKAKCQKLNRFVAVKVLKQEFSENTNFVSKFRIEAQAAAGLMHPNIVNVYDVGEENNIYYIVMELVEGITLKKYIEKKARLSVKEAISIAIQVSMGIEAAHNNNIIHRDIKPQNIIISKEGKVKVTDFGIAKAATSNTITSNVMGSVHYTSPEQARGGYSDEKSDIYSLGITLFEMLTGRVPFNGETTVAIAIKHIQEEMPSPRDFVAEIPISVEQIVFKCTQKSPDRRYQSVPELVEDLKYSLLNPDEDFVKVVDFENKEETRMISDGELSRIKKKSDYRNTMPDEYYVENEGRKQTSKKKGKKEEYYIEEDENDDEFDPKMSKLMTVLTIVAAVIIGCILLFIAGRAVGLFSWPFAQENSQMTMVAVEGMTLTKAKEKLDKEEIPYEVKYEESSEAEKDIVLSSSVKVGERIPKNTNVILSVSTGKDGVAVPSVENISEAEATATLENEGFEVIKEMSESSEVKKGYVISQSPKAGEKVTRESAITITISTGSEDSKVRVPEVRGMTETAAKSTLESAGLICTSVGEEINGEYPTGTVSYQSYSVGAFVPKGTGVDIRLSTGGNYSCNVNVQAPIDYQSGEASVVLTADNGTQLFSTVVTSFPVAINLNGIKGSQGGEITISYHVSAEQEVTDENGNVTNQVTQVPQVEKIPVNFTVE